MLNLDELDHIVEDLAPAMVEACRRVLVHASTKAPSAGPGKPFGEGIAAALECVLQEGKGLGFSGTNIEGYAAHIEMGQGDELVGILAHVDVVPVGPGWTLPPFAGTVRDGRLYGRGAIDDKGPAIAGLYAMKAVAESGIPLTRRVRLILGTDEESEWECMSRYFETEEKPVMSFTPDGEFPIVVGEKGLLASYLTWPPAAGDARVPVSAAAPGHVSALAGGTAVNAVPSEAHVSVSLVAADLEAAQQTEASWTATRPGVVTVSPSPAAPGASSVITTITAHGKAAHGSTPKEGENAIVALAEFLVAAGLAKCDVLGAAVAGAVTWVAESIGQAHDGSRLGVAWHHDPTGDLTANVGLMALEPDGSVRISLDIRFPFGIESGVVIDAVRRSAPGAQVVTGSLKQPIYLDPADPLVVALSCAYQGATGEPVTALCMGGTTYAKALPGRCVAFGPVGHGEVETAHQADEYWEIAGMIRAARIYARAIVELAGPTAASSQAGSGTPAESGAGSPE